MESKLKNRETVAIGLMMFALFLGAGNLIFPPAMGQGAGEHIWIATLGFLVTGVGLPLLGITAIAISGGDLQALSSRVHPTFGLVFTLLVYLAIGPLFGIPRTGTVAYEIGVFPFLSERLNTSAFPLLIFTLIFYSITFIVSLNPSKLVTAIGKVLTPILLVLLTILAFRGILFPIGDLQSAKFDYIEQPFFQGFLDGYLTMDAIAALVFGIIIISRIQEKGITNKKVLTLTTIKAGVIAVVGLSAVYLSLAYLGATSVSVIGELDNGGAILTSIAQLLFGWFGMVILALVITVACLTTSIGLVSACGEYVNQLFPKLSYPMIIAVICIFSMTMANLGLTQLIQVSLPILIAIYPIAIVLIMISFLDPLFGGSRYVYSGGVIGAGLISIVDGFITASFQFTKIVELYGLIPLYNVGVGWIIPSLVGAIVGYGISKRKT